MNMSEQHVDIDGYVAGQLPADRVAEVEQHIAGCDECRQETDTLREMQEFLGDVPPEALLEGYPEDADLVLQRTLRQMRQETSSAKRRGRVLNVAAAVVAAGVLVTGGVLVGQAGGDPAQQIAGGQPTQTTNQPAGVKFASATDPATGARITVRVTPAAGWIRVNAAVSGIPAGEKCRLIIVGKDGTEESAGSWVVPHNEQGNGTTLDGAALIPANDVASVVVETTGGKKYVTTSV